MTILDMILNFLYILIHLFSQATAFLWGELIGEEASLILGGNIGLLILITVIYLAWGTVARILKYILVLGWAFIAIRIIIALGLHI